MRTCLYIENSLVLSSPGLRVIAYIECALLNDTSISVNDLTIAVLIIDVHAE